MTLILGIETSCDETAAAVVEDGRRVLGNVVASQVNLHEKYGGVVPEIASRAHIEWLNGTLTEAMRQAGLTPDRIDALAVSNAPGLVGCLLIGVTAAKALAWAWQKPLVAVNHVHAHAFSPALELDEIPIPAVALVVSGGHTALYHVHTVHKITRMGSTTDDAAGEAFDKVASILRLGYPGGPVIDRVARTGNPGAIAFPRTMLGKDSLDFSFSGIKTAVLYHVHGPGRTTGGYEKLTRQDIADIAASFQQAVIDVLVSKTMLAVARVGARHVLLGGGVAANACLRRTLSAACDAARVSFHPAPMQYCTDNAAMGAALAYHHLKAGRLADLSLAAKSTAP
jgi:N6-L-threonylcarbamoyladenine synthase